MNIGIDSRLYSSRFTGIGRYVKELVDWVPRIDRQNRYFLFFNEPEYHTYTPASDNVQKVLVHAKHYSLREQTSFLWDLRNAKLDLMHFTHFNAPVLYKAPSVVTIHDLTLHKFPGQHKKSFVHKAAYRLTIQRVARQARRIITVSQHTKKDAKELLGIPESKISVIYEGIANIFHPVTDENVIKQTLEKYHIRQPYFFYTGAWRPHKNLLQLVEAFRLFCANETKPQYLVLGGMYQGNTYADEVLECVRKTGLTERVITTGHIDEHDLPTLYSAAESFVFPSLYEGFGLPALEAFSCGTPVACSNVTSMPEICGTAAEYFDPEDSASITASLTRIASSDSYRTSLINKGFAQARKFSWEKMAKETIALYHEAVSMASHTDS